MKIILFHQYFLGKNDPGGSRWNKFVEYFSQKDESIEIDIIAGNIHYATGMQMGASAWQNEENLSKNITLYRTWTYAGYNKNFFGRLMGYFSYTFSSLVKALFLKKADIIIVTSPPLFIGVSALLLSKIKRIPFIFEVRDLWPESAIATGVLKSKYLISILYHLEKMLYKHAKKIIVLTPAFEKDIVARFPEYKHKISIITNGADFDMLIDSSRATMIRNKYAWKNKKVFAYFGAHGLANDLMQIIEIANVYRNNDNILFVLVGDGMQKSSLKEKAKDYNLSNIQFIDSVSKQEVNDYIVACDVCMAILKKTDTFKTVYPNKVFDYMRCKKPVLVTIDGITRVLMEESQCGLYAKPEDMNDLKQTIQIFENLSSRALKTMGENGFVYVKKYFDREKLSAEYFSIIKKEMNAKKTV